MSAIEAAESLADSLAQFRWFVSTGTGTVDNREGIYVYVTSVNHPELKKLRDGYKGFAVVVSKTGAVRPAIPA